MQKELEIFKEKFKIKSLKKFSQSECENLSLAFSGLEYSRLLGLDKIPDKVNIYLNHLIPINNYLVCGL
jgi:hypothetical protein